MQLSTFFLNYTAAFDVIKLNISSISQAEKDALLGTPTSTYLLQNIKGANDTANDCICALVKKRNFFLTIIIHSP